MSKSYSLDKYRKAVKGTPFVLDLGDEKSITIPRPSGKNILKLGKVEDPEVVLQIIAGDQFEALMAEIGEDDYEVMNAVSTDMAKHFGISGPESDG